MIMLKVKMTKSQAMDSKIANGFLFAGYDIIVDPERNPDLPPLVESEWKGGRVDATAFASSPQSTAAVTTTVIGRPEDGTIHQRVTPLVYQRRPSKQGGTVVQCKSWANTPEYNELEDLARLLSYTSLDELLEKLASGWFPTPAVCEKAAIGLNRSMGSVVGKLRDLRRKALVTHKRP